MDGYSPPLVSQGPPAYRLTSQPCFSLRVHQSHTHNIQEIPPHHYSVRNRSKVLNLGHAGPAASQKKSRNKHSMPQLQSQPQGFPDTAAADADAKRNPLTSPSHSPARARGFAGAQGAAAPPHGMGSHSYPAWNSNPSWSWLDLKR